MSKKVDNIDCFTLGERVLIARTQTHGEVIDGPNKRNEYLIETGTMKIWVPSKQLKHPKQPRKRKDTRGAHRQPQQDYGSQSYRLDLHGLGSEEALARLEDTIDRALLNTVSRIEVIHGKGTGTLCQAVHQYLAQSKHISSFRLDENNPGTTWVYL